MRTTWLLLLIASLTTMVGQPIAPMVAVQDTNELGGPLTKTGTLSWSYASNTLQYSWGFSNVATNLTGTATGLSVPIIVVLGSNWVQVRSENLVATNPWLLKTVFIYYTNTVTLWPQPEYRDLLSNNLWANWLTVTNSLPITFAPTGWGRQYRCKLTATNWWGVQ